MKKAVGYIKAGKEGKKQREVIAEYCKENDIAVVSWMENDGDGFGKIAFGNWMHGQKFDAVIVADSTDVSSSIYEFYAYKSVLKRRYSDLIAVENKFAGHGLYIKLFDELVDTIHRIELENAPKSVVNKRMDKKARGAYIGGQAPMGYRTENGKLVVNQDEVPVVEFIIDRKHQGKTMLSTVDALNEGGFKTRRGGKFQISTVQSIWKNEQFYKGYRKFGDGEWVKGQHEAIIKE